VIAPAVSAPTAGVDAFFEHALQVYAQAAADEVVRDYTLAGRAWRVHYATAALADSLGPALAHLEAPPAADPFCVYAWGGELPGGHLPPPPWETLPYFERGNVRGYYGPRWALAYDGRPGAFSAVDHARQVGVYWAHDSGNLPYYERAAPFRRLLPAWRQPDGLFVAHAAAVGFRQGGALLAGRTGSGKSTTAALCIGSALGFAGDDYILVQPGRPPRLYGLYNTAKLNATVLEWLPGLAPAVANADRLSIEKALVYVAGRWPERVSREFPLRAILLPRPAAQTATVARPVTAEAAYKALLPDTLFSALGPPGLVTRALSEVVRAVPCYELALGSDLAGVPAAIEALLAQHRSGECV
jgi:hypothetical protein